ncbi:MAG: restriction endonuclease subunit S [Clostridia bacterium]
MMVKEVTVRAKDYLIPDDWEANRLIECLDFKNGKAFYKVGYTNQGKKVIDLMNISREGKFQELDGKQKYISKEDYEKYSDYQLEKNDLIIAMSDMSKKLWILGRTAIIPKNNEYILNQRIGKLSYNGNMDIKFANYATNANYFLRQLKVVAKGTAQKYVNTGEIKNSIIFSPPFEEQKKIALILSSVDQTIEKTDEVIEKTKELKKGLMQQLLTKGIGHDEFKEVSVGPFEINIPKEWEVLDFKDVLDDLKSGLSRKLQSEDVGVPVIRSTNMVNGKINFEDIKYWYWKDPKGANVENYLLREGDILVNFINSMAHIGKACIYKDMGRKVIYTTNVFRTRVNEDIIKNKYFYYYTQSNYYQKEIERISKQAVNQASFTTGDFKNIFIPLPPLEEQKKIAAILSTVDEKIQKEEEYKEKLEELKKGLMQKLLTGEVRVKVAN